MKNPGDNCWKMGITLGKNGDKLCPLFLPLRKMGISYPQAIGITL